MILLIMKRMMEDTVNKCDNLWPLLLIFDALLCSMIFLSYSFTNDVIVLAVVQRVIVVLMIFVLFSLMLTRK